MPQLRNSITVAKAGADKAELRVVAFLVVIPEGNLRLFRPASIHPEI
ncbi:hypothetical protein GRAN_3191 [Granulicella sibirica]|uniref:Uncharacterized protein n=1 Tax=Granulicella sibirica TaxID=2479048 RepID=A0A4V1L5N0_9BACT|nr:hypothetical protein GRAN_3191 [Granulicella sibirica]